MNGLLVVEGPRDVAVLRKVLSARWGFRPAVPAAVPPEVRDALFTASGPLGRPAGAVDRPDQPSVVGRGSPDASEWIGLACAGGVDQVAAHLRVLTAAPHPWSAVGIIVDADDRPDSRRAQIERALVQAGLASPPTAGPGLAGPRTGIFLLPDDGGQGTLEDLLAACAEIAWPSLLREARDFVARAATEMKRLPKDERKHFEQASGRLKATLGALAALLRPGRNFQASLQDNRWIDAATLPCFGRMIAFLEKLFELR